MIASEKKSANKNVLMIVDVESCESVQYIKYCISHLKKMSPLFIIYTQDLQTFPHTHLYSKEDHIDCVIVIGESSLLQRVFGLFQFKDSPPIIGMASGHQPILYNYCCTEAEELLELIPHQILNDNICTQNLMKIQILSSEGVPMIESTCEIEIHRGIYQSAIKINMYLINKCTNEPIKIGQMCGDGLLISTPLGSMCKSMNFNGPIMHRQMQNIFIIPICPLSLKFRPLCLPATTQFIFEIDQSSRSSGFIYVDHSDSGIQLSPGQKILVSMSKFKTKFAANMLNSDDETFIEILKEVLHWGQLYESKGYLQGLKKKNTLQLQE